MSRHHNLHPSTNLFNRSNRITICVWNCDGISRKKQEFMDFIHREEVVVALLQETHLNPNNHFQIPNYKTYRTDRVTHKGGGTAIIIRKDIAHVENYISSLLSGMEATTITLNHKGMDRIQLTSCHPPPPKKKNLWTRCTSLSFSTAHLRPSLLET